MHKSGNMLRFACGCGTETVYRITPENAGLGTPNGCPTCGKEIHGMRDAIVDYRRLYESATKRSLQLYFQVKDEEK
jgi:hypothetical protein